MTGGFAKTLARLGTITQKDLADLATQSGKSDSETRKSTQKNQASLDNTFISLWQRSRKVNNASLSRNFKASAQYKTLIKTKCLSKIEIQSRQLQKKKKKTQPRDLQSLRFFWGKKSIVGQSCTVHNVLQKPRVPERPAGGPVSFLHLFKEQ